MRGLVPRVLGCVLLAGCGSADRRAAPPPAPALAPPERIAPPAPAPEPPPAPPEGDPEADALARAFLERMTVWTRADGGRVLSRRCREGPVDCEARLAAFARLIAEAARRHGLDPFLLGALAWRESGLDPSAVGRNGVAGLVQLHPRGAGRGMRFVEDRRYREACQAELEACQGPVLDRGAETLAAAIGRCGSIEAGLGAYAAGHCTDRGVHPERVLDEQRRLRELAE